MFALVVVTMIMTAYNNSLAAASGVGPVTLRVAQLDRMTDYYHRGVGLDVLDQRGDRVILGSAGSPIITLEHTPLLKHAPSGAAGLFHTAIVFGQQSELASSVYSLARNFQGSFTGSSDHLVSEALYFDDPEGNGVELYWDRPQEEWSWTENRVAMDTIYLDPNAFLQEHLTDTGLVGPEALTAEVGHVHLKVGDVATAREFYVDTVGFDVTAEYGEQALFVSAGGYHHHLGMNTWQSRGARDRSPALGLGEVTLTVPTLEDRGALAERLASRKIAVRDSGDVLTFEDPWRNEIRVTVAGGH